VHIKHHFIPFRSINTRKKSSSQHYSSAQTIRTHIIIWESSTKPRRYMTSM